LPKNKILHKGDSAPRHTARQSIIEEITQTELKRVVKFMNIQVKKEWNL